VSAPTTEQVRAWLADEEGAAEFDRYASDGIQDRASASARTLREVALPLAEHRDAVVAVRDALAVEVKRLQEALATSEAERRAWQAAAATRDGTIARLTNERAALRTERDSMAASEDGLIKERDALTAEVKRLREVIATKHAIERSSVGVAALAEECETLRAELKRLRQAFLAKSIRLLVAEQPKKEDEGG